MYFLLIFLHILFIVTTHFLGFYIVEGIFIVSLLFSLFYFSPFFFVKEEGSFSFPEFNFSLKETVNLPVILFYIGVYIAIFGFADEGISFSGAHTSFLLLIFLILFGVFFSFQKQKTIFFDASRIHLSIVYSTIIFYSLFSQDSISLIFTSILIIFTHIFSFIFFYMSEKEKPYLFFFWILSILSSILLGISFLFPNIPPSYFPSIITLVSIFFFEILPKTLFFKQFHTTTRIFLLILILAMSLFMAYTAIFSLPFLFLVFFVILFLFSVHIRYGNPTCLIIGISYIYFIYSVLFFPLLQTGSIVSILLFIFFLPVCIIGNTYFWEQRSRHDFTILHYSGIGFSCVFSLYSCIFLSLGTFLIPFISLTIVLLSLLSLLSYFRFTYT